MHEIFANGLTGSTYNRLKRANYDPAVLRPWYETYADGITPTGRNFITMQVGVDPNSGKPIMKNILTNAPSMLRFQDWQLMDETVIRTYEQNLSFWSDIYGANPYNIPNGMGVISVGDTTVTGKAEAIISMDPIRKSQRQRQVYDTRQIPLPVIHSDNSWTLRQQAVSERGGAAFDSAAIVMGTRAVAEKVEALALGTAGSYKFGAGTVYGAMNHPLRMTKTITAPAAGGWSPATTQNEVAAMIQQMEDNNFKGPYIAYYNNVWTQYLVRDFSTTYASPTLGNRLREFQKIRAWRQLDTMPVDKFRILLIQMTPDVIQGMNGMSVRAVQWDEEGGFESHVKILCINVPRVRPNAEGTATGILDSASVSLVA